MTFFIFGDIFYDIPFGKFKQDDKREDFVQLSSHFASKVSFDFFDLLTQESNMRSILQNICKTGNTDNKLSFHLADLSFKIAKLPFKIAKFSLKIGAISCKSVS